MGGNGHARTKDGRRGGVEDIQGNEGMQRRGESQGEARRGNKNRPSNPSAKGKVLMLMTVRTEMAIATLITMGSQGMRKQV